MPDRAHPTSSVSDEPTPAQARAWFPPVPGRYKALGWKEHLFEFVVTPCGDLMLPHHVDAARKGLDAHAGDAAHLFFFLGVPMEGPHSKHEAHVFDTAIHRQQLQNGHQPVLITRTVYAGIAVCQTIFCHYPGGAELTRGDEPLFAWVRFEVEDVDDFTAPHLGALGVNVHVAKFCHRTTMVKGMNAFFDPVTPYPRKLAWEKPFLFEKDSGKVRLALASKNPVNWWHTDHKLHYDSPLFQSTDNDLLSLQMPAKQGAFLDLVVPVLGVDRPTIAAEIALGRDEALRQTLAFWDGQFKNAAIIRTPWELANHTLHHLPIDIMTTAERDIDTRVAALPTGSYTYEGVWPVDTAMAAVWALDYLGFHQQAADYLDLFHGSDPVPPPGKFFANHPGWLSPPKRYSRVPWVANHGAILWAVAEHGLITDDPAFIDKWLPLLLHAADWIAVQRRQKNHPGHMGLLPPGVATDDGAPGQFVWNDAWCYKGLVTLVTLLERLHHPAAPRWRQEAVNYRQRFVEVFRDACKLTWKDSRGHAHPFLPTNILNESIGQAFHGFYLDTGPLFLGFAGLLDADDPLMHAALAWFTHGPTARFHLGDSDHSVPPALVHEMSSCEPCYSWNLFLRLARNQRAPIAEGLHALLVGGQDPDTLSGLETRHGRFGLHASGELTAGVLRLSLVDDLRQDGALHLLAAAPASWFTPGQTVEMSRLPTRFGPMSLRTQGTPDGLTLDITPPNRHAIPAGLLLHVPLADLREINLDGAWRPCDASKPIPLPHTRALHLEFRR
ncbi:MAG: hypothetical protein IT577_03195 [Verrucomicrobiae bacterium]|nr:hypothetical protein [Verrucomicrobiae bacterium]